MLTWLVATSLLSSAAFARCPDVIFQWSSPETEIGQPIFSPDGSAIAFSARGHIPDAAEAEQYDTNALDRYVKSKEKIRGFGEPRLAVLHLGSAGVQLGPSGWQPCFSADGKTVFYAAQKHPISGLRVLNDTLEGNGIGAYEIASGANRILAQPDSGFYSSPAVGADPSVVYFVHHPARLRYLQNPGIGYVQSPTQSYSIDLTSQQQKVVSDGSEGKLYRSQQRQRGYPTVLKSPDNSQAVEYWPEFFLSGRGRPLMIRSLAGRVECSWSPKGEIWDAAWSPDSSKLMVVFSTYNFADPSAYRDHLVVFGFPSNDRKR
jgi:hypothetical protein